MEEGSAGSRRRAGAAGEASGPAPIKYLLLASAERRILIQPQIGVMGILKKNFLKIAKFSPFREKKNKTLGVVTGFSFKEQLPRVGWGESATIVLSASPPSAHPPPASTTMSTTLGFSILGLSFRPSG